MRPVPEAGLFSAWPGVGPLRAWAQRHPTTADVLLAVVLSPLTLGLKHKPIPPGMAAWPEPLLVAVLGAPILAALAFRRRFPMGVLVTVCALTLLQGRMLVPQPTAEVAILVALYTVAAYSDRRRAALVFGVIEVIVAGMAVGIRVDAGAGRFLLISAFLTAALVLGANVRTRRAYLASLEDRAIRAERERDHQSQIAAARERALIAREMHNIVAHNLSVMIALADGAAFAVRTNADAAETAARHVSETGRQALDEMHRLLGVLRGTGEESPRAPQPGITQIDELVAQVRTAGLPVSWTVTGQRFPLSTTAELAVYRVAQEALTNVLKHATAPSEARIRLTYADPVATLEITDDGAGLVSTVDRGAGHGLSGMRERVAVFGGDVEAGPQPGGGWRVAARIGPARVPVPAEPVTSGASPRAGGSATRNPRKATAGGAP